MAAAQRTETASHAATVTYIQEDPLKGITQQARIWKVLQLPALLCEVAKSESAWVLFSMMVKEDSAIVDYETATFTTKYKTEKRNIDPATPFPYPTHMFHFFSSIFP